MGLGHASGARNVWWYVDFLVERNWISHSHRGGCFTHYATKSNLFNDFICFNNLFHLGFPRVSFTCCHGQSWCADRWAYLNWFLANLDQLGYFDFYSVSQLQCISFDDSPLFLKTHMYYLLKNKIFPFEKFQMKYNGCHDLWLKFGVLPLKLLLCRLFSHSLSYEELTYFQDSICVLHFGRRH